MAKYCKELCYEYKGIPNHRHPFKDKKICRTCEVFYPIDSDAGSANICFCCKNKLGIKAKRNKSNCKIEVARY